MRTALLFALLFLLSGCLETEARLVYQRDGSAELRILAEGEPALLSLLAERLAAAGFGVRVEGRRVWAKALLVTRWAGMLPGRWRYEDPSGLVFERVSWFLGEEVWIAGAFVPLEVAGLPAVFAPVPFRFVVEAPAPPLFTNAPKVEERRLVWPGRLGDRFVVRARFRLWHPERGLWLLVPVTALVLWRRSRRPRGARNRAS